jgi:hypothetical protein
MGVPYGSNAAYPIYMFTNPYHLRFLFSYNPYHAQLLFQFAPANNCVELMYLGCLTKVVLLKQKNGTEFGLILIHS